MGKRCTLEEVKIIGHLRKLDIHDPVRPNRRYLRALRELADVIARPSHIIFENA